MATTSLWRVHGWLGKVIIYIENPDKTENPKFFEKPEMTEHQTQGLLDVIEYAVNINKTADKTHDEAAPVVRQFVSGVNVTPVTARESMMKTKQEFSKTDGVVAYHGYQSFAPGEATPEIAHEIGVKLAHQLWGDKYQVLVATHLDKSNHLHTHFVINTVSHIDGKKFHRTKQDYYNMQKASDALCREYGLSVIEQPQPGQSKHYGEWKAEQDGRQTWRGMVKSDVDAVIRQSMTERQFFDNLHKMGYEIKIGKDISVRPPGKERFVRLRRNFGDDYDIEAIRRRILAQNRPERRIILPDPPPKKVSFRGTIHTARKLTGLRALYFYYLDRMGVLPKRKTSKPNPKQVYFLFREDIRHMQNISRETRLLVAHGIDTAEQLTGYKESVSARMQTLFENRKRLRYRTRKVTDAGELAALKSEIAALSDKIGELRREVRLCDDIETRSGVMRDKVRRARKDAAAKKSNAKEVRKNEPLRRRR